MVLPLRPRRRSSSRARPGVPRGPGSRVGGASTLPPLPLQQQRRPRPGLRLGRVLHSPPPRIPPSPHHSRPGTRAGGEPLLPLWYSSFLTLEHIYFFTHFFHRLYAYLWVYLAALAREDVARPP